MKLDTSLKGKYQIYMVRPRTGYAKNTSCKKGIVKFDDIRQLLLATGGLARVDTIGEKYTLVAMKTITTPIKMLWWHNGFHIQLDSIEHNPEGDWVPGNVQADFG